MFVTFFAFVLFVIGTGPVAGVTQAGARVARADTLANERDSGSCVAREIARSRLIVDGDRELYLEPNVLAVSGTRALLAGKPSYLFAKRDAAAAAELESRHTVFGAVIERDGSARIVPPPPVKGRKATAVAAIGSSGAAWRVIFAELDSIAVGAPQKVDAYWHGVYDGQGWSSLERLPRPEGMPLLYFNTSELAQHGDTVVWAAMAEVAGTRQGVVVFERRRGNWAYHVVDTPFASDMALIHSEATGFVLAVTHADTANGAGRNLVSLHTRASGWSLRRTVLPGTSTGFAGASLESSGGVDVLSWTSRVGRDAESRVELRAMVGSLGNQDQAILVVDPSIGQGYATVLLGGRIVLWATDHLTPSSGMQELRLVGPTTRSTTVLWRTAQPYRGPFTATSYSPSEVWIVGPELDVAQELLVSLILRVRVECESGRDGRN